MLDKAKIKDLMTKPLWQLTGEEYVQLHVYACSLSDIAETVPETRVTGVRALAEYLSCCESTVYMLMREGVLDSAVVSRIGKSTVFDAELARELAQAYMQEHRRTKNTQII